MPTLPRYGWLFKCEDCDIVTSRITIVKHRKRTKEVSVCLKCRHNFVHWLLEDFNTVIISDETVARQILKVS